jgi:nucleoside 2-deoxyribosyltransferase
MACAIWHSEAKEDDPQGDWRDIMSARVGTKYRVVGSHDARVGRLTIEQKLSLSRWIMQQHELGVKLPELHGDNLDEATSLPPLRFSDKVRAVLLYIAKRLTRLDGGFLVYESTPVQPEVGALLSLVELRDLNELKYLLKVMEDIGLVANTSNSIGTSLINLTPRGWERVEELTTAAVIPSQAFVAMWFNEATQDAYDKGIAPAIRAAGYQSLRIDNKEHVNKIDDEIVAEIRRSRFLVADFTCEPEKVRGGVYFEAGFAMALPIPVIWTCNERSGRDLHFDTRQYNHIMWMEPSDLHDKLLARIGALLGDGPLKKR